LPFLSPFYSRPVTLSFTEGWGEDKKNPVSLETGFSKKGDEPTRRGGEHVVPIKKMSLVFSDKAH
jgi:hypothetical protein